MPVFLLNEWSVDISTSSFTNLLSVLFQRIIYPCNLCLFAYILLTSNLSQHFSYRNLPAVSIRLTQCCWNVFPVILSVDRWLWPICFSLGCSYTAGPGAPKESLLWRGIWQTVHPSYITSICLTFTTHTLVCFVYYAIDINYKITLQILQSPMNTNEDITCYLFVFCHIKCQIKP